MIGSRKANCSAALSAGPDRLNPMVAKIRQMTSMTRMSWATQICRRPKTGTHNVLPAKAPASHQPVRRCTSRPSWPGSIW